MAGKKGFGAKFSYETTPGGASYTDVANVTKIKPFDLNADVLDVTAHDTTADANGNGWREKLAGLIDAGAVALDLNYDDKATTHIALKAQIGVSRLFKVTFYASASPTPATFSGFIKSLSPEVPHDNKMTCTCGIEISGQVTIA
jgi:predicted secreted protein